jgi:hypothetical protein
MMLFLELWMAGDAECCFEKVLDEGENCSQFDSGWRREVPRVKMREVV